MGGIYRNLEHLGRHGQGDRQDHLQRRDAAPVDGGAAGVRRQCLEPAVPRTLGQHYPVNADGKFERPPGAIDIESGHNTVWNCSARGIRTGYSVGQTPGGTAIIGNCDATDWEDYGCYVSGKKVAAGQARTGYFAILGSRLAQHPQALQGGNGKSVKDLANRHGSMRWHARRYHHVDALDTMARNGWTTVAGMPVDQNGLRDHRSDPESLAFISRWGCEAGWGGYANGPATTKDGTGDGADEGLESVYKPCNTVIDKACLLGGARNVLLLGISASAFTARNVILHRANVGTGADVPARAIQIGTGNVLFFRVRVRVEPIRLYNFTIVNELDNIQQARNNQAAPSWVPIDIRAGCHDKRTVQIANSVVHRPNFSGGFVADGPLDSTRLGLVPRYLGYRWKNHVASNLGDKLVMDTSFATPANPFSLWRPRRAAEGSPASPAIGSAAGPLVAYDDMVGAVRPQPASRGAPGAAQGRGD